MEPNDLFFRLNRLNYHHLYHFWWVGRLGNLTRAADQLHVAQSAVSTHVHRLESALGQTLFDRQGRALQLTEAGRVAMRHAEEIFQSGAELVGLLSEGKEGRTRDVHVGAVSTLSRNFQEAFLSPLIGSSDVNMTLSSGRLDDLLKALENHNLDLILSNTAVTPGAAGIRSCQEIARQVGSIVGPPRLMETSSRVSDIDGVPLLLPGRSSGFRASFDLYCRRMGVTPVIVAEVDDMAMLRLLARDSNFAAVLPKVVVKDELRSGMLVEYGELPDVYEYFYAITEKRRYDKPVILELLRQLDDVHLHQSMRASE
mgnify:FL=1